MSERFIGKYEVVSTLGKGSMGVVYKARDPEIGRIVAIKTLKTMVMGNDAAGEEALQRFRQESRSAGMLHHPNIVTIFEAGKTENGSPYIVMEHIDGDSLEQRIKNIGAVPPLEVLHYLSQVASAIDYAHSQNVIHRDIKPSNVIVGSDFKPFLLDFGVAKLADTSLTPAGTVVGTPSYMSPEQIRGLQLDGRTDIFSLAVVAFELFTGVRPYPGKDFTTVVTNIMHKEPRSFEELGIQLPAALEVEVHKGLAKDRDERFSSALAMIHSFAQVFSVLVDGGGLVGGYRPEMEHDPGTLEIEALKDKPTIPVSRPNLSQAPKSSGLSNVGGTTTDVSANSQNRWLYGLGLLGLLACGGFVAFAAIQKNAPAPRTSEIDTQIEDENKVEEAQQMDEAHSQTASSSFEDSEPDVVAEPVDVASTTPARLADVNSPFVPEEPATGFTAQSLSSLSNEQLRALTGQSQLKPSSLRAIAKEFAKRGAGDFIDSLLILLENEDYAVRVAALKCLRLDEILEQRQVLVEVSRALKDQEYLVRGFAAKILSKSKDKMVLKALQEQLEVEVHPVVKKVLQQALEG